MEKSFSHDEEVIKPSVGVDEILFDKDGSMMVIDDDKNSEDLKDDSSKGIIKDDIKVIKAKAKDISDRKLKNKKLFDEETDKMSKQMKVEAVKAKKRKWLRILLFIFIPDNWVKFIQYFEELLFVLTVDVPLALIFLSLMYIFYIIYSFDMETSSDLMVGIFKLVGGICVCVLSMIAQLNVNSNNKGK